MLTADQDGRLTGKFTIPANIPVGSKEVVATGQGGSEGSAVFVGSGQIENRLLRQVFTRRTVRVRNWDPLAQSFTLPEDRHITSVEVKFATIGDVTKPVICQIRPVELGIVTTEVVAECVVDMTTVNTDDLTKFTMEMPVLLSGDQPYAPVFLTDDANHSLCTAKLGEFDQNLQRWVTAQPYQIGVLQSSSNGASWTLHQDQDLMFKINCAKFTANQRIVDAGNLDLVNCSDLIISAQSETPSLGTSIEVLVTRADGTQIRTQDNQRLSFTDYLNETVNIKFILKGNEKHSPVLYPVVQYIMGELGATGDYVSRAMPADAGQPMNAVVALDCLLPTGGSDLTVEVGVPANGGDPAEWATAQIHQTLPLGDGWQERVYKVEGYQKANARIRLTLNGNPGARPRLRKLRANITEDPIDITGTPELAAA
jgi:hypothetical protein